MYSSSILPVTFLIWTRLSGCLTNQHPSIQNQIPDIPIISDILDYVRPFIKSFQVVPNTVFNQGTDREATVKDVIDAKIKELKHFFRAGHTLEKTEHKLELEGDEETTIIEFVPKAHSNTIFSKRKDSESIVENINKFKHIRNQIALALKKETVSDKTKAIVTNTIDELIVKLLESQCPTGSGSEQYRRRILDRLISFFDHCYINDTKIEKEECKKIFPSLLLEIDPKVKEFFEKMFGIRPNNNNTTTNQPSKTFFDKFTDTVSNMLRNTESISEKYKVKCTVVDTEKTHKKPALRSKDSCDNFRICAEEFRHFLTNFYKSLNHTAVSVFRNYAAMYARDVNTDDVDEKKSVITTINDISVSVEKRVAKVFTKYTWKFRLDENKSRAANADAVKEFVRKTVRHIDKKIKKHLGNDLQSFRARLLLAVKADIDNNLSADLRNLANDLEEKICSFFITCDGEMFGTFRRRINATEIKTKPHSVYVKVQMTLDERLKDKIAEKYKYIMGRSNYESGNAPVTRTTMRMRQAFDTTLTNSISSSSEDSYAEVKTISTKFK